MSSMPGLKMFFRQFDRRILKRFFERHDASFAAEIDWEKAHPQLAFDILYCGLYRLRRRNWNSVQRLYAKLIDIMVLSEGWWKVRGRMAWVRRMMRGWLMKRGLESKLEELAEFGEPSAQTLAMWMWLEVPDFFKELLARKLMHPKSGAADYRYLPQPSLYRMATDLEAFKEHVKECLERERGYGLRVYVERSDLGRCSRFVVNSDTLPPPEDAIGEMERTTDSFYITYIAGWGRHPAQFAIRDVRFFTPDGLVKSLRDQIADCFAQDVLGSHKGTMPEEPEPEARQEVQLAAKTNCGAKAAKAKRRGRRGGTRIYTDKDEQAIIDFVEKPAYELNRQREGVTCYNVAKAARDWAVEKHAKRFPQNPKDFKKAYENIKRRRRNSRR